MFLLFFLQQFLISSRPISRIRVFLAFFLLRFCLVRGEKVVSAQDFGWRSKGEDYFKSRFPFFSFLLVTIQILSGYLSCPKTLMYNSFIVFDRGFSFFFVFSQSLIGNLASTNYQMTHLLEVKTSWWLYNEDCIMSSI